MTRIEAATETARPVALGLIEKFGASKTEAIRVAALFAVFMDKNADVFDALASEGHAPESIASAALSAFQTFCRNAS